MGELDTCHVPDELSVFSAFKSGPDNLRIDVQEQTLTLFLETGPDFDASDVAELALSLRRTLLETDVNDAQLGQGDGLPEGAKAGAEIDWNAIILSLIWSGTLITSLKLTLNAWLKHRPHVRLILNRPSEADVQTENALQLLRGGPIFLADGRDIPPSDLRNLRQTMTDHLNLTDFQMICFDMGVDINHLGGLNDNLTGKIIALIDYCRRRGIIEELKLRCGETIPHVAW